MDIEYSGQAKKVVALKKSDFEIPIDPEFEEINKAILKHVADHADEFFVAEKLAESDRGNFHISYENRITVDSLKLEEFTRIIQEQAFLRNLALSREDTFDGGITIRWYPREDIDNV